MSTQVLRASEDTLSPVRRSVSRGGTVSFRERMERALSPGRPKYMNEEPRGRDPLISTGRGGAGNLVREISRGPDEMAAGAERGRELRERSVERATHAGRGGAGNIRSPSRDPKTSAICEMQEDALQDALIAERRGREVNQTFTTGRGGAGNITTESRSRSRSAARGRTPELGDNGREFSPSPAAAALRAASNSRTRNGNGRDESRGPKGFHAGRGGYGNITEEAGEEEMARNAQEDLYEAAVKRRYEAEEPASKTTGRGGAGSLSTQAHLSPEDMAKLSIEEREAHDKFHKEEMKQPIRGGRGGAGNIVSREDRGRDSNHHHTASTGGVFGSMFRSLSRAARGEAKEPAKG